MSSVLDTSTASVFDPVPAPTHLDASSAGLRMTPAEYDAVETWDRHRDFVEKRSEYLKLGVREYWVIDRFRRTLTVCTTPDGEAGKRVVKADGTYRTDLLPGFELVLADVLAEADEFEPPETSA
ncbi:MAG: Uma2 family endonuclease [Planctomycetota bacterium]